jgi:hypothetical protein
MIYFKEIDIDNLETIQKKCLDYVKTKEEIYKRLKPIGWYLFNLEELKVSCPELQESFSKINLDIIYAGVIVIMEQKDMSVHCDNSPQDVRINIPLLNCANTFTKFYSNIKTEIAINPITGYILNKVYNLDEIIYEDEFELRKATVLRVNEGHTVTLPKSNPVPRISLTLGFKQDLIYLLN